MLAIISDIHDNLVNLEKVLKYCKDKNIATLICCGDICNSETLKYLADNFKNTIYLAEGNMELYEENEPEVYDNIKFFGRDGGIFEYNNKKIGLCHEPYRLEKLIKDYNKKNKTTKLDIIFYGHTHQPWEKTENRIRAVNPGNVANVRHQPSFAIYDTKTDKLILKILNEM